MLEGLLTSYTSRLVAFVLTPILLPVATTVAVWLQDALGVDLTGGQLTAYVVAIASGLALTAATWLMNRGKWEIAEAELHKLYDLGKQHVEADPSQPVGLPPA